MNLAKLSEKYGCDKGPSGHAYTDVYDILFKSLKYLPIKLAEIGVYKGVSFRVWHQFFPNAQLYALDIIQDHLESNHMKNLDRTIRYRLDQSKKEELETFGIKYGPFDIIIDDGSHQGSHQVLTFETLWPQIKPGGLYIVEDVNCSYFEEYAGKSLHDNYLLYSKDIIDDLNFYGRRELNKKRGFQVNVHKRADVSQRQKEILSISFSPGLIILKKRQ